MQIGCRGNILTTKGCPKKSPHYENSKTLDQIAIQRCQGENWGVHTSVDALVTCARHLVMAQMCSAPQNTHIQTAQTLLNKNSTTFLKTISFWDTLQIRNDVKNITSLDIFSVRKEKLKFLFSHPLVRCQWKCFSLLLLFVWQTNNNHHFLLSKSIIYHSRFQT